MLKFTVAFAAAALGSDGDRGKPALAQSNEQFFPLLVLIPHRPLTHRTALSRLPTACRDYLTLLNEA